MGLKVENLLGVEEMLLLVETDTKRRVVKSLFKAGRKIQQMAIKMAPIDHGNLEKAIKMLPAESGGRERDELGRFTKTEIQIFVDMGMPIPERPGKTIGDYAYEVHEHLTPRGNWNLGDKSNQKQLGSPDVIVGGGYMDRAADLVASDNDIEKEFLNN